MKKTPSSAADRPAQPWWNPQQPSGMPIHRYQRDAPRELLEPGTRSWLDHPPGHAPLWSSVDLRDGNQALANPMDIERKQKMFDLLLRLGFKDIEVGYPSASEADFDFVRHLVTGDHIPGDVAVSVFTSAKPELIDRTFEAVRGAHNAIVHLCHATACLWREIVFRMTPSEVMALARESAEQLVRLADRATGAIRFEYSPETFNLDRRDSIILSVHPHNDRGTAVAAAEFALAAGADRVEGTLFGNGERTGNVCLVTLALNLFSRGIDPQLDLSDIATVRRTVEECNEMPVPARHPYAGDLVFTAFSGTHQDAIAKGLAHLEDRAAAAGLPAAELPWDVPYLPTELRVEFAKVIQRVTDVTGVEVEPDRIWDAFRAEYCDAGHWATFEPGGDDPITALLEIVRERGVDAGVDRLVSDQAGPASGAAHACYARILMDHRPVWGVGLSSTPQKAAAQAVLSALHRGGARTDGDRPVPHLAGPREGAR